MSDARAHVLLIYFFRPLRPWQQMQSQSRRSHMQISRTRSLCALLVTKVLRLRLRRRGERDAQGRKASCGRMVDLVPKAEARLRCERWTAGARGGPQDPPGDARAWMWASTVSRYRGIHHPAIIIHQLRTAFPRG